MENGMVSTFRGDLAHWKSKMRGLNFPGDFARGKEKVSTCPGDYTHGKEKTQNLDFTGEFARGTEKLRISAYPGN
jgi:hypothetical protein